MKNLLLALLLMVPVEVFASDADWTKSQSCSVKTNSLGTGIVEVYCDGEFVSQLSTPICDTCPQEIFAKRLSLIWGEFKKAGLNFQTSIGEGSVIVFVRD